MLLPRRDEKTEISRGLSSSQSAQAYARGTLSLSRRVRSRVYIQRMMTRGRKTLGSAPPTAVCFKKKDTEEKLVAPLTQFDAAAAQRVRCSSLEGCKFYSDNERRVSTLEKAHARLLLAFLAAARFYFACGTTICMYTMGNARLVGYASFFYNF